MDPIEYVRLLQTLLWGNSANHYTNVQFKNKQNKPLDWKKNLEQTLIEFAFYYSELTTWAHADPTRCVNR